MSLYDAPQAERTHIGFFGVRNAGKSSVVNAVTGQSLAVVSPVAGTTTDPVRKTMELLPIGPVLIIDTPGIDDEGELGALRVKKTRRVLDSTDIAVLVIDALRGKTEADRQLIALFQERQIPYVLAYNKCELLPGDGSAPREFGAATGDDERELQPDLVPPRGALYVSAKEGRNIGDLKEMIGQLVRRDEPERHVVSDLVAPGDNVVLVTPIDSAAPKGRLILPQQMTLRDLLDAGVLAHVVRETELAALLDALKQPPALVVTDSQAFGVVSRIVPPQVPLTSFSILFARYKGNLASEVAGANELDALHDGDTVLLAEGCTHHRQCDDIGTVKMPKWIAAYTGADLRYEFTSGGEFPDDLSRYKLVVHCGGCMLNAREMRWRIRHAAAQGIPLTNYGVLIAKMNGILPRVLSPFGTGALAGK